MNYDEEIGFAFRVLQAKCSVKLNSNVFTEREGRAQRAGVFAHSPQ